MINPELLVNVVYLASKGAEKPGLMDFQVSTVFYTFVSFIVFLWIMTKFAWKPIAKMLNERAERIKKNIADAEQANKDAEQNKLLYEEKLTKVHEKVEQIRLDGREQGERLKMQIEHDAREEAKRIIERARKDIVLQKKSAEAELRIATLENSLKIASELIKKSLTEEEHRKLAEEIIEHIDEIQPV